MKRMPAANASAAVLSLLLQVLQSHKLQESASDLSG
jgi:hypothetical protein